MTAEIRWRPRAREDLLDIFEIIGADDPSAAERIIDAIHARAQRLATHPRLGPRRPDIGPMVRALSERPYLILYETEPNSDAGPIASVEVVRVIDGRRDLTTLD